MSDCLKQLFFERKESSEWEYQTRITELAQTRGRDRVRLRHVMAWVGFMTADAQLNKTKPYNFSYLTKIFFELVLILVRHLFFSIHFYNRYAMLKCGSRNEHDTSVLKCLHSCYLIFCLSTRNVVDLFIFFGRKSWHTLMTTHGSWSRCSVGHAV